MVSDEIALSISRSKKKRSGRTSPKRKIIANLSPRILYYESVFNSIPNQSRKRERFDCLFHADSFSKKEGEPVEGSPAMKIVLLQTVNVSIKVPCDLPNDKGIGGGIHAVHAGNAVSGNIGIVFR